MSKRKISGALPPVNLVGLRVGWLTVRAYAGRGRYGRSWDCVCDCGKSKIVCTSFLNARRVTSCGCQYRKHGRSLGDPTYKIWLAMNHRCSNPNDKRYDRYGGRGIAVCERWKDFKNFLADMGEQPRGLSIDRIDNDGPYAPDNCRWASHKQQANNRSSNRIITHNGKTQTLAQWADELGMAWEALDYRFRRGWSVARALTEPLNAYFPSKTGEKK